MYFISKAVKGHEYLYSKQFMVKCSSKKQAMQLAEHLNKNNDTCLVESWKLKDNETWHFYESDGWEEPMWKVGRTKGCIKFVENV